MLRQLVRLLRLGSLSTRRMLSTCSTKATQLGLNNSEDFLDTVNEYGTQFRKLGLTGAESIGLMSQAVKAGARDTDLAADALKEFSIRAIDGSELSAKLLLILHTSKTVLR